MIRTKVWTSIASKAPGVCETQSTGSRIESIYLWRAKPAFGGHPDGYFAQYEYDALNRVDRIAENGVFSGAQLLADYAYDPRGRRLSLTRGNGTVTSYGYDPASRLNALTQNLAGTADDQTFGFAYTPASQVSQRTAANDNYNWAGSNLTRSYARNGLNQYTSTTGSGAASYSYDTRGNFTNDGARRFCYDLENRLTAVAPVATDPCVTASTMALAYDPLGRLRQTNASSVTTDFLYDGDRLSAEYNGAGTLLRRYVHGPGVDEPLVWYEGSGTSDRRYLITDHQGSVIAENGAATTRYSYGPYGEPNTWVGSRFRYTGQIVLPEVNLYHYKARVYDPVLGRFLQTDPVGYEDDFNLYAYVANDPLNMTDPLGLAGCDDMASQGVSGACFDAANFDEDKADASLNIVSNSETDSGVAAAGPGFAEDGTENGFRVDRSTVTPAGTPGANGDTSTVSFLPSELEGADAFGHSHPEDVAADESGGAGSRPTKDGANPGPGDGAAALQAGMPLYITHRGQTIVIEVSGGQARVRVVAGNVNRTERNNIRSRLRDMQGRMQR